MADNFDAIADSTKREILQILLERGGTGEISTADLAEQLGVTAPTAAKHLGVLRELGFVSAREDGRVRYFHLELAPFDSLQSWLAPFVTDSYGTGPATSTEPASEGDATVFNAWAGTDVGTNFGRALADRSFRARSAVHDASEKVANALPDAMTRRFTNKS